MFSFIIDKLTNVTILNIQNITLFGISLYSMYSCVNYLLTSETNSFCESSFCKTETLQIADIDTYIKPFDNLLWFIRIYAIVDIFFVSTMDITLHHLTIIGMTFYTWYNSLNKIHRFIFLYPLIKTEISTFFFVLTHWLPKNTYIYNINSILFYITFCKFRIFDMYNELINSNALNIVINTYTPYNSLLSGIGYLSIYGLYMINVYWFFIMIKMLYKKFCKNTFINTDIMCQYICSYIHYINIPLATYIYSYNKREQNIFDVVGIVLLSLSSYLYHYEIYERLYKNQITEYILEKNINYNHFVNDCICIHTRYFLAIVTNYYNNLYFYPVIIYCCLSHIVFIHCCIVNMELNKTYALLNIHYFLVFLPILIDFIALYFNTTNEIAIPFMFVNLMILLLIIVEPFYKLTHCVIHILVIVQNFYICLTNISANM